MKPTTPTKALAVTLLFFAAGVPLGDASHTDEPAMWELKDASGVDWTLQTGTVPWSLDHITSELEATGTTALPLLDQVVRIAARQVEVWTPAQRIVLEEDSNGDWVKVADITAQMFTGVDIQGVGIAWPSQIATQPFYYSPWSKWVGMFGVSQMKSQSGYDGSTEIAETAAHELAHIAGHVGHDNDCMDRSWYSSCKKHSVMHEDDRDSVQMDMRKASATAIKQHSHAHL